MFGSGLTPDRIAARRDLKATTVYSHLARCIEEGEIEVGEVVDLTDEELKAIEHAFSQLPEAAPFALKPVFDAFAGRYDYGVLRCVRAGLGMPGE